MSHWDEKLAALDREPDRPVDLVHFHYNHVNRSVALALAKRRATEINLGISEEYNKYFPAHRYASVYMDEDEECRCVVMVIKREYVPEAWKKFVFGTTETK